MSKKIVITNIEQIGTSDYYYFILEIDGQRKQAIVPRMITRKKLAKIFEIPYSRVKKLCAHLRSESNTALGKKRYFDVLEFANLFKGVDVYV